MTVTFSPSSLAFGDTAIGEKPTMSVIVSNSDTTTSVTVTCPSGPAFSMSPSPATVPAAPDGNTPGVVTVTISFGPSATQGYADKLSEPQGATCSLSGTGVQAYTDVIQKTKKSLFIEVPDFGTGPFQQPGGASENVTMTSFLRLGNFDFATETQRAKDLLSVIHLAGPPGDPNRSQAYWTLDSSTGTLSTTTGDFLMAPPFQPRNTDPTAAGDASTNTAPGANNVGNQDVFFLDDVRTRDVDLDPTLLGSPSPLAYAGHGLTMDQRQKESAQLYARGGWRDHSDGNRITTTYGDKVEVIRGNYKMIILGRQDSPSKAQGWEVSGSHVADYAEGTMPGASYWLEWVPDYYNPSQNRFNKHGHPEVPQGAWLLVNTTEGVYQYSRNAGTFRTETWGDLNETYIGSENPTCPSSDNTVNGSVVPYDSAPSDADDWLPGTKGHEPPVLVDGIQYNLPNRPPALQSHQDPRSTPSWPTDTSGKIRSNPHVVSKTWASRIDTWMGSEDGKVPFISQKTWANNMETYTYVSETSTNITYASDMLTEAHVSGTNTTNTYGGNLESDTVVDNIESATIAKMSTSMTLAGLTSEMALVGMATSLKLAGAQNDVLVAAAHDEWELSAVHSSFELNLARLELQASVLHMAVSAALFKFEMAPTLFQLFANRKTTTTTKFKVISLTADLGLAEVEV
jgi:hypothetical protein